MKSTIETYVKSERGKVVVGELSICNMAHPPFVVLCTNKRTGSPTFCGVVVHSDNPIRKLGAHCCDLSIDAFEPFYGRVTLDGKE